MQRMLACTRARFVIDLPPDKAHDVLGGVREQLASMLLTWNEDLGGVVLGFDEERLADRQVGYRQRWHPMMQPPPSRATQGTVCYWYPMLRVHAQATVLLFRPKVGQRIGTWSWHATQR